MSVTTTDAFDASLFCQLSSDVSLRDEAFGALAYHHGTRRLVFLKSPELVDLVRRLADFASVRDALDALIAVSEHERYLAALSSLWTSGLLRGR